MGWWTKLAVTLGCFAALVMAGLGGVSLLRLRLNLSNSLPRGVYQETDEPIHVGTLVAECLPPHLAQLAQERGWVGKGYCPTGTPPILKQVVAIAGDTVEVTDYFIAVNGVKIPHSATQKRDSHGRDVPAIPRGTYLLASGEVFLLATNIPNSWDSRYTGPAQLTDIMTTARPVWTEGSNER